MEWQVEPVPFGDGPGLCAGCPGLFTEEYMAEIWETQRHDEATCKLGLAPPLLGDKLCTWHLGTRPTPCKNCMALENN